MIIASLGKLSVAQSISDSDENSTNQIQMAAVDYAAITDAWWVVDTYTVAATTGTLKFELVLATDNTLGTAVQIACVELADVLDIRSATLGRHIVNMNVGKMLKEMLGSSGSTYPFIGQKNTLGTGVTIYINSVLSPTEPQSETHRMNTVSGVGVPAVASAGSGF